MDKKELIKEWLSKARHDLGTAEITIENKPEYTDIACFHCQQVVEKCLKAYCLKLGVLFEHSHDLIYLLDLIQKKTEINEEFYVMCEKLNDYSVEIRYPDDWYEPTLEEAKEAFSIADNIYNTIEELIK